jgi:RHS repeat-associated protein
MRKRIVAILALGFLGVTAVNGQMPPDPEEKRDNPTGNTGALKGQIQTGGSYNAHSGNATRSVTDLQVPGALGEYGLDFTRYWNSTHNDYDDPDAEWSTDFGPSGWSHSWKWNATLTEETIQPPEGWGEWIYKTTITITFPDGHTSKYKITRSNWWHGTAPPDPRTGPPYTQPEIDSLWPYGGVGVRDHLCNMAANGTEFWLCRADGGSVHFTGGPANNYRATAVYDPHGMKTTLTYDPVTGRLMKVEDEGGRYITLTWSPFADGGVMITKVETGGNAGLQQVTYQYSRKGGYYYLLTLVSYQNDPAPGQTAFALYGYGFEYAPNVTYPSSDPMLKSADDPRYAGAMTKIRYDYWGVGCPVILINPHLYPEWVGAQPYAIAAERSSAGDLVSSFGIDCNGGLREETNGLGGTRKFYFGNSAGTFEAAGNLHCRGFQLGKVTDFTTGSIGTGSPCPPGVACQRQNFDFGEPRHIWDGRSNRTQEFQTQGDGSGSPGTVVYMDGSNRTYDRVNPGASSALDGSRMHNSYKHWLFSKKDELGNVTVYTRDSRRRVTQIAYYNGPAQGNPIAVESYSYNDRNQVTSHTLPSGAIQTYEYNGLHQLEREYNSVDTFNERKEYTYDSLGRVATMRDGRAIQDNALYTVMMEYNGRHKVTKVHYRFANGNSDPTVSYEYDKYGNCTAITNELGHRSVYTYDAYRRCTSYTEPLNAPGWDGSGNVASRRWDWFYDREVEGDPVVRLSYTHTSKEWRIQIEPVFNSSSHRRAAARTFDVNNRMLTERTGLIQLPTASLGTLQTVPDTETHRVAYDGNGQKSSFIDPLNRETTYEYDNRKRLWKTNETINTLPRTTETLYDPAGNKLSVKFPDQKIQRWESYDAFGQPGRFYDERNNFTDLTYQWGPMKKLDTVRTYRQKDSPPGGLETQLTSFEYDGMGRPRQTLFPDGSDEFSFYKFGQLSDFKTRKDQTKRLYYDARGREDYHTWDANTAPGIDRAWDDANRLTSIANVFSTVEYGYDDAGQARWERTSVAGGSGQAQISYNRYPSGEVSRLTYPNASVVTRHYTARGQLQGVGWAGDMSTSYAYLLDGKVDYQARSNHVTTSYGYNGRGMISSVRHRNDAEGRDLAKRDYWRDERDRITAWKRGTDPYYNGMEDGRGNRYQYDAEGQLERAWYRALNPETETPGDPKRGDNFQYDELGNRKGSNDVASRGPLNFTRKNNGLNQYSGWWPYSITRYDDDVGGTWGSPGTANGVLMEEGYITAAFNALNQPVAIWSKMYAGTATWMFFGYDPLGRCVKRWKGPAATGTPEYPYATYFYYDGWNLVQEGLSVASADRTYVHGGRVDEIVASQVSGLWYHHHYDAQRNAILLSTTSGGMMEQYDYDAFGFPYFYNALGQKSTPRTRFLFTGREWITDLRLYDYRHRLYQPELGRFLQPDPKQFEAGDYNLYRYCHNDPVNKSDPTGLTIVPAEDLQDQWKKVKPELMKDPVTRNIINRLERKDVKVELLRTKDPVSRATFDKGFRIFWNPNSALKSKEGGTLLSPAVALGHEMDHTHEALTNPSGYISNYKTPDAQYRRVEERRVITNGSEASMLKTFYNEGPRSDYDVIPYYVADPLSR